MSDALVIVTGGAGFIGSNMIKKLNDHGITNIVVVDDLEDGKKFKNLADLQFVDYIDKARFLNWFANDGIYYDNEEAQIADFMGVEQLRILAQDPDTEVIAEVVDAGENFESNIACVIHMGGCSNTSEWDGKKMMNDNFSFTRDLIEVCQSAKIPLIYASSASVYGNGYGEADPLNVYAFSKMCIDRYFMNLVQKRLKEKRNFSQIVGLRFFNVYGPREGHKIVKGQASPVSKWLDQIQKGNMNISIFGGDAKNAKRDFVYVEDVCDIILWFMDNSTSGIFDVGTGVSRTFDGVFEHLKFHFPEIEKNEVPFPEELRDHYQFLTKADLSKLRSVGCDHEFLSLAQGIERMIK